MMGDRVDYKNYRIEMEDNEIQKIKQNNFNWNYKNDFLYTAFKCFALKLFKFEKDDNEKFMFKLGYKKSDSGEIEQILEYIQPVGFDISKIIFKGIKTQKKRLQDIKPGSFKEFKSRCIQ